MARRGGRARNVTALGRGFGAQRTPSGQPEQRGSGRRPACEAALPARSWGPQRLQGPADERNRGTPGPGKRNRQHRRSVGRGCEGPSSRIRGSACATFFPPKHSREVYSRGRQDKLFPSPSAPRNYRQVYLGKTGASMPRLPRPHPGKAPPGVPAGWKPVSGQEEGLRL